VSERVQELQSVDDDERATRDADPAYLSPDYAGARLQAPRRPLLRRRPARIDLTPDEIEEVLLQTAFHCGAPAANGAFAAAQAVLADESAV
jgi:hypothetical protein